MKKSLSAQFFLFVVIIFVLIVADAAKNIFVDADTNAVNHLVDVLIIGVIHADDSVNSA